MFIFLISLERFVEDSSRSLSKIFLRLMFLSF